MLWPFTYQAMHAAQDLMNRLGSGNLHHEAGFPDLDADVRSNYLMNTGISGIEKADAVLMIGANPRVEAPVFNARCVMEMLLPMSVWEPQTIGMGLSPDIASADLRQQATLVCSIAMNWYCGPWLRRCWTVLLLTCWSSLLTA